MKLVWSDPAVADLEAIHHHIGQDSEFYAAGLIAKILEAVERLEDFPHLGRHVPEAPEDPDVRELLVQSYRVFYRVEAERLLVLAVIHGSRDLSSPELRRRAVH